MKSLRLILAIVPLIASAETLWRGDFETNDLSQWSGTLNPSMGARSNIMIVDSPIFEGRHAAEIIVHPDDVFPNGHNRVELRYEGQRTREGETTCFSWRFRLAANAQVHEDIAYWESKGPEYRQSMAFYVDPAGGETRLGFRTNLPSSKEHWVKLIHAGEWHRLSMKILWSQDSAKGRVSIWLDDLPVLNDVNAQTKPNDADLFIQMGFHRDTPRASIETIYIDDAIETTSISSGGPQ